MNLVHLKFLIFLNTLKNDIESNLTEVIFTNKGPVQGEIRKTVQKSIKYSAFRGIRYGKPPVGYARFKPPEEAEPWTEIFNATSEATPCPQKDVINRVYIGDEDCLNLNVYTPRTNFKDTSKKLLPVMVWIHGGGFYSGWTNMTFFGPDFLVESDIVVVAMNYRLGALGFLSLNHTNATGNAGLKDQLLALKWVKINIEKFGGDPNSVTIFGHSAGAVSVDYHILAKDSEGLFHRTISMSGSHFCKWAFSTTSEAELQAFGLGKRLGIYFGTDKEKLLTSLYEQSPQDLVQGAIEMHFIDLPFKPTLEDPSIAGDTAFFSRCPDDIYKSGDFNKLPHMTGFMKDEAIILGPGDNFKSIKNILNTEVSVQNNNTDFFSMFHWRTMYSNILVGGFKMLSSGMSEAAFVMGIDLKQRLLNKYSSAPLYYYRISFASNVSIHKQIHLLEMDGAAHEDELAYIWYVSLLKYPEDPKNSFLVMKNRMTRMWTNFAKFGNPTPDGESDPLLNITWPISRINHTYLDINEKMLIDNNPTHAVTKVISTVVRNVYYHDQCSVAY